MLTLPHPIQGIRPEALLIDDAGIVRYDDVYGLAHLLCLTNQILTLSPAGTLDQVFFKENQLVTGRTPLFGMSSRVDTSSTRWANEPFPEDISRRKIFARAQPRLEMFPTQGHAAVLTT